MMCRPDKYRPNFQRKSDLLFHEDIPQMQLQYNCPSDTYMTVVRAIGAIFRIISGSRMIIETSELSLTAISRTSPRMINLKAMMTVMMVAIMKSMKNNNDNRKCRQLHQNKTHTPAGNNMYE